MNIEIRETRTVNNKKVIQITTLGERWYKIDDKFKPSTTWITSYVPKGIQYYKWLAEHGWDEAEQIKREAGERGSKIHQAIDNLIKGEVVKMTDKYTNHNTGQQEEFSPDEWEAIMSFVSWYNETNPIILRNEFTIEGTNYAGTIDMLYIDNNGKYHLLDIKSGQNIWLSHTAQLSSYKKALEEILKIKIDFIEILQVGYKRNKAKYKLTELEYNIDLFNSAYTFWENENKNTSPRQIDYPMELKIAKKEVKKEVKKIVHKKVVKKKIVKKIKKIK